MEKIKKYISSHNTTFRTISNIAGCAAMFVAGLLFVMMLDVNKDVKLPSKDAENIILSAWLLLVIILSVGGGVFYLFGDSIKHLRKKTLVLKAIGIALSIGYIVFLIWFPDFFIGKVTNPTKKFIAGVNLDSTISLIIAILGLIGLSANYVLSIIFLDEDY